MTNPYTPQSGIPPRVAPKWARKRFVLPALAVAFFIGLGAAGGGDTGGDAQSAADQPQPTATATVTTTATATETAEPEPAATVTVRATRTVKATVTAQPADGGSGGSSAGDESVYYGNCSEARAAGAAPVHRGEPGYGSHLDRDGDGVGCDI
ncbi:excalibur calcium-binding domain-containing protein [Streptomyces himalayensis]|uniref:Excalibur calcium-binding domain-containing protein n=1 Tax=Streptomyces himalayensis subsp. himalayensis TaxID=2756131 RepID=A0A7W0DLM4_9ACTN|nr:excalibur calcium-binding domain-containing protein [Streptomyces himalayensis]MBA2946903.1 excalibur calcium-binding domain-containing protein [Streptomyces himalayensis subsp. himalayensis]